MGSSFYMLVPSLAWWLCKSTWVHSQCISSKSSLLFSKQSEKDFECVTSLCCPSSNPLKLVCSYLCDRWGNCALKRWQKLIRATQMIKWTGRSIPPWPFSKLCHSTQPDKSPKVSWRQLFVPATGPSYLLFTVQLTLDLRFIGNFWVLPTEKQIHKYKHLFSLLSFCLEYVI